ncbi:hypothetical protein [Lewinella sp. W8]|uniref:hypothetical protein n=1 Tax=Lewinella sp. W8 TaxID=2528208 RepID=UPI0010675B6E|nr:hypothetical protein [Lewinella sp. W8]MTB51840.1 hypothetical protein [Lewinella sp. W8]
MHPLKKLLLPCLLLTLPFTHCTQEQLVQGRVAEQLYVDLMSDLHAGDTAAAKVSMANFDKQLEHLRGQWYRPMGERAREELRYHLDKAEVAYGDVRSSILNGDLEGAKVLLDRATYELYAADPAAFQELHVGRLYDFISTWQEVETIVNDQMLCLMEWGEFTWWAKKARIEWRAVKKYSPDPLLYNSSNFDHDAFATAHAELERQINFFVGKLEEGDQCSAQEASSEVSTALWELLALFGSPEVVEELPN